MSDQRSTRKGGHYSTGEVSVTTVLGVIDKPGLNYWFQEMVFNAAIDGAKTLSQARSMMFKVSGKAMGDGTKVHKYVEQMNEGLVPEKYDHLMDYYKAYHQWIVDYKPVFLENEVTVTSKEFGYKGTFDILVKKDGKRILIDLKTGKAIYHDSVGPQASAYQNAYEEETGEKIDEIWCLLLEKGDNGLPTGKYVFEKLDYCLDIFLAALKIYTWKKGMKKK